MPERRLSSLVIIFDAVEITTVSGLFDWPCYVFVLALGFKANTTQEQEQRVGEKQRKWINVVHLKNKIKKIPEERGDEEEV